MLLEILLIILISCFVATGTLIYLWWRKYGKKIFDLVRNLNTIKPVNNVNPNNKNQIDELKSSMEMLNNLMGTIKKQPRR
jgi:hypothetical protein